MKMKLEQMDLRLRGLVIVRGILQDPVVKRYAAMVAASGDPAAFVTAAAEFEAALFDSGRCWTDYLLDTVLENNNICIRRAAAGGAGPAAEAALASELAVLQQAGEWGMEELLDDAPEALRQAKAEAQKIIDAANKQRSQILDKAAEEATAEKNRILEAARAEIEAEKNKAREELRAEVINLALAGAEKILNKKVDSKSDQDMVRKIVETL